MVILIVKNNSKIFCEKKKKNQCLYDNKYKKIVKSIK